jgi:hypothetical protein
LHIAFGNPEPPAAPIKNGKRSREDGAKGEQPPPKKKARKVISQTDKYIDAVIKARSIEGALGVRQEDIPTWMRLFLQLQQPLPNIFHIYKTENPETTAKMTKADFDSMLAANPHVLTDLEHKLHQRKQEHYFKNLVINPDYEIVIHDAQKTFTENERSKPLEERRSWKNLSPSDKNELFVRQNDTRTWAKDIYRDAAATRQRMFNEGTPLWTVLL